MIAIITATAKQIYPKINIKNLVMPIGFRCELIAAAFYTGTGPPPIRLLHTPQPWRHKTVRDMVLFDCPGNDRKRLAARWEFHGKLGGAN